MYVQDTGSPGGPAQFILWLYSMLNKVSQSSVISVICTRQATDHQDVCAFARHRLTWRAWGTVYSLAVLHAQQGATELSMHALKL
jgi:hypothetical protein